MPDARWAVRRAGQRRRDLQGRPGRPAPAGRVRTQEPRRPRACCMQTFVHPTSGPPPGGAPGCSRTPPARPRASARCSSATSCWRTATCPPSRCAARWTGAAPRRWPAAVLAAFGSARGRHAAQAAPQKRRKPPGCLGRACRGRRSVRGAHACPSAAAERLRVCGAQQGLPGERRGGARGVGARVQGGAAARRARGGLRAAAH